MIKYENPIISIWHKMSDCILLSLFWILFSLPVITVGAATAALYYTSVKVIRKEYGYVWAEFYTYFKTYFLQATVIWLIYVGVISLLGLALWGSYTVAASDPSMGVLSVVLMSLLGFAVIAATVTLAFSARSDLPVKQIMKNGVLICLLNMGWGILLLALLFLACLLFLYFPVMIVLLPGPFCLTVSFILERVFRKYIRCDRLEE